MSSVEVAQVELGSTVTVLEKGWDQPETYKLVVPADADHRIGLVSTSSPFGQALLNKLSGESIAVPAPLGDVHFTIINVS